MDDRPRRRHRRAVRAARTIRPKYARGAKRARPSMEPSLEKWLADAPRLECDWETLKATYRRSLVDLAALRFSPLDRRGHEPACRGPAVVHDHVRPRQHLHEPAGAAVHAGAGGDDAARARRRQGSRIDDFRDEDPGRILHEMRYGEMTAFEERPHSPYYGCADATPLYVVLLDEYERWTGDTKLVRELEHEARAALNWIDEYADLMGNGYISYQRRNEETGLENQCWKDSWDSISYRDGTAARLPARDLRAAGLRVRREDARRAPGAPRLEGPGVRRRAREGGGRPEAPLQPRLLGRGRRVLRARARHRRAIRSTRWPRTTATCSGAASSTSPRRRRSPATCMGRGCSPAGASARSPRAKAATTRSATTSGPSGRSTTRSSPGACGATASRRRPRRSPPASSTPPSSSTVACPRRSAATARTVTKYPVQYPTACSPQAWSTGAPLLLLRTMLGLEPIGDHLVVDPALPDGIGHLELLDIPGRWGRIDAFGRGRVDVEQRRR